MPGDIIFSHDVPSTYGDWLFLAGCAASYCELVYVNMKREWDKAGQKYRALTPFPESHGLITLKNYRQKTKLAYKSTLKNLQKKDLLIQINSLFNLTDNYLINHNELVLFSF
jgi:hypothetical protein